MTRRWPSAASAGSIWRTGGSPASAGRGRGRQGRCVMPAYDPVAARRRRIYGRRRGRPLRPGQLHLHEKLLPQLAVTLPETGVLDPAALFEKRPEAVWLEIGFGAGEHLAAQAEAHPEIGFIGC